MNSLRQWLLDHWDTSAPRMPLAWLRIALGLMLVTTSWENSRKGLYTGPGFRHFVEGYLIPGNTLGWYRAFLQNVVIPNAQWFAVFQGIVEPLIGLLLLVGLFTPLAAAGSAVFTFNLLLGWWGNPDEWIWAYVFLVLISAAVGLARAGRSLGVDRYLAQRFPDVTLPLW